MVNRVGSAVTTDTNSDALSVPYIGVGSNLGRETSIYVVGTFDGATAQIQVNPYAADYTGSSNANTWFDVDGGSFTDATASVVKLLKEIAFTAKQIRFSVTGSTGNTSIEVFVA